jgi:signal peptidase I
MFQSRFVVVTLVLGVAVALAIGVLTGPALSYMFDGNRAGRNFSIPSESMTPALQKGDRVTPRAFSVGRLRRGMVVVFAKGEEMWVFRVAGLPGDTVRMVAGKLVLNGKPVEFKPDGEGPTDEQGVPMRRFLEQFPGEPSPHRILDSGFGIQDDTDAFLVPQGRVFLLGDNRDDANDSRFGDSRMGPGMVAITDIYGEVDSISWSTGRWRIGRAIDDLGPDGALGGW